MSVEQQAQANELRLQAELDRLRFESAHNYRMAEAATKVAEQQGQQCLNHPAHNFAVVHMNAPNTNPAPQPDQAVMQDQAMELRKIFEQEMQQRTTTLHDQAMREGSTYRQVIERLKGENAMGIERSELALQGQVRSEVRASKLEQEVARLKREAEEREKIISTTSGQRLS